MTEYDNKKKEHVTKKQVTGMKIKICGITSEKEAAYLNDNKVDYAGFVFYEKSKRNITIDKARLIMNSLNSNIKKVAVMVSPTLDEVLKIEDAGFDIIQIHGELHEAILDRTRKEVWCAINLSDEEYEEKIRWLNSLEPNQYAKITGIVIDSKNFGAGEVFDWQRNKDKLEGKAFKDKTFILAGGLNSDNVADAISILHPDIVDVSSGVEGSHDKVGKDKILIDSFVLSVRQSLRSD